MKPAYPHSIQIRDEKCGAGLSKEQKTFNRLTAKIEKLRRQLAAWQNVMPLFQQRYAGEFLSLLHGFHEQRVQMVRLLDRAHAEYKFTKTEKAKLADIIALMAADLLATHSTADLKEIYLRHGGDDLEAEQEAGHEAIKSVIEDMFGIDLDEEIDFDSPESIMSQIEEKLRQQPGEEAARKAPPERRKTARQIASEQKAEEEAKNISQSIREVYRKLASALHPDREQDAAERKRKTLLMQRVNLAYDNKDLLQLLELQLEIESLDQNKINTFSPDRLKYFNKVLADQSDRLREEIEEIDFSFRVRLNLAPGKALSPDMVLRIIEGDIENLRDDIDDIKGDLVAFEHAANIKQWLKTFRRRPQNANRGRFSSLMDEDPFY